MKFASFSYRGSCNIGDEIQTVAAIGLLPQLDQFVERDALDGVTDTGPVAVIMSGWFSDAPEHWPPSACIRPIFVGFHMSGVAARAYERHADYFRLHQPIGCRDRGTEAILRGWGIDAYTSYCCTLTLPRRDRAPAFGKTMLVDIDKVHLPDSIQRSAVRFTHRVPPVGHEAKLAYARDILRFYREEASLVVTTRLHCALPCMAMGIPVIFFARQPGDYRISIVSDVGGKTYNIRQHRKSMSGMPGRLIDPVDWSPPAVDVSSVAQRIREDVQRRIERLQATG